VGPYQSGILLEVDGDKVTCKGDPKVCEDKFVDLYPKFLSVVSVVGSIGWMQKS
jgi:hypothetical protein